MEIIADLHTHTLASAHAYSTVTENAKQAAEMGMRYMAMTDHGIGTPDAPHEWHFFNMKVIPDELFGVRIIRGIEADIKNSEGELNIFDERMYPLLEWVNASMHEAVYAPHTKAEHTAAYLGALKNPYVDVLCHTEAERYDYDFDAVIKECSERERLIELNVTRLRTRAEAGERYTKILAVCAKYGTRIVVNSDAHFFTAIGDFSAAADFLAKIGFPEELVLNASCERIENYLRKRAERISASK